MAMRLKIDDLLAAVGRMSRREKYMVGGTAIALVIFVTFFVSMWVSGSLEAKERRVAEKSAKVKAIIDVRTQYEEAKEAQRQSEDIMRNGSKIQVLATLEEVGRQLGVNIGNMKSTPQTMDAESHIVEEKVEVLIPLITIDRLVDFMQEVERRSRTLKVRNLRVQHSFREPTQLDVSLTVSNFKLMEDKDRDKEKGKEATPAPGPKSPPAPKVDLPPAGGL